MACECKRCGKPRECDCEYCTQCMVDLCHIPENGDYDIMKVIKDEHDY